MTAFNLFLEVKPMPAPRPRVTRNGTYNKKEYTQYKELIKMAYIAKYKGCLTYKPVAMYLDFFFKIPKSWSKKKKENARWHTSRPDSDNLAKSIKDALNCVAYLDDSQVCFLQVRKQYAQMNGVKIYLLVA